MQRKSHTVLFAGPSLRTELRNELLNDDIQLLPPIRRFDIPRLLESNFRGTMIIADGYFYQDMSVGHREIMDAIALGCKVFGLSSMGAIRAYEMRDYGMTGFGKVYDWFFKIDDFQDDEVALMHAPVEPYFQLTEPLVHYRECLFQLLLAGEISKAEHDQLLDKLKKQFFGLRTLAQFRQLLETSTRIDPSLVIMNFDQYRIKQSDLEQFCKRRLWENNLS